MITGTQCRAARALVEWPREQLARASRTDEQVIADFEQRQEDPPEEVKNRLTHALEEAGAVFIPENGGGVGVRLRFNRREVRSLNRWEGEGGRPGEDDV
jgi:hypothetical protein